MRKVIEETIEKNSLRLALKEEPRSPVFLIGQIGNTPLSMHGESGRLVFQTPDGSIQRLCYENFGHNLTKGVTHGTESRDNERKETKGETQGLQNSSTPSTSSEDVVETSDAGGERKGAHERSCAYGVLDRESEQDGDSQAFGDSPSENLATLSASYLRDACGTALATQDESEGHGAFHGGRSEETQEENNGSGRTESETGEIDRRPSNDAECLRNENNDEGIVEGGEDGCRRAKRDARENFVWQWENFFAKKKEQGEE